MKKEKAARTIPKGFQTVTPYLIIPGADRLIEFIKNAFGGEVTFMNRDEENQISHATVKVGNSTIMISDSMNEMKPETGMLFLYVDDVDATYNKAIQAKAQSIQEPKDEFYGDRVSAVKDEWDNKWWIATHVEDVDKEELEKRAKQARKEKAEAMAH
ncbi:MAG TPA: VOC family protein [Cyclobacteriaceae bacterium]|nr:VOC family protein [Cyclobacteriaceae bacterium]